MDVLIEERGGSNPWSRFVIRHGFEHVVEQSEPDHIRSDKYFRRGHVHIGRLDCAAYTRNHMSQIRMRRRGETVRQNKNKT